MATTRITCDALLFDNDGVLVDSHSQVMQAWAELADEFGIDFDKLRTTLVGARSRDTLSKHLAEETLDRAVERLEVLEVELAAANAPLAGALELTNQLAEGPWAIVTSASRVLAEARWHGASIVKPRHTISADDVSRGKPDPEPFLAGAKALGVDPSRCVVFEDSAPGGEAGRAAGATVIAVGDQPWAFEPEHRVNDLSQVTALRDTDGWLIEISGDAN